MKLFWGRAFWIGVRAYLTGTYFKVGAHLAAAKNINRTTYHFLHEADYYA